MMKVEHIHTNPFMERMMLSGWMGPWAMMAATSAKRMERAEKSKPSPTVSVKGAGPSAAGAGAGAGGGGSGDELDDWPHPLA